MGTLTSFSIGEDGIIRGAFSNGISRTLGQIRLARFTNVQGLEQQGRNMFAVGANSGLAIEGDPGQNGIGRLVAGAVELSNTDIGQNLDRPGIGFDTVPRQHPGDHDLSAAVRRVAEPETITPFVLRISRRRGPALHDP